MAANWRRAGRERVGIKSGMSGSSRRVTNPPPIAAARARTDPPTHGGRNGGNHPSPHQWWAQWRPPVVARTDPPTHGGCNGGKHPPPHPWRPQWRPPALALRPTHVTAAMAAACRCCALALLTGHVRQHPLLFVNGVVCVFVQR